MLSGKSVEEIIAEATQDDGTFVDDHDKITDLHHKYCVKYSIINVSEDSEETDIDSLRRRLNRIGSYVHVDGDLSCIHVHVHTNHPGNAIEDGLEIGEVIDFRLENIVEERRRKERELHPESAVEEKKEPEKEYGMVAVSLGDGFSQIFHDLGVDKVVEGGQTMNPSIEDIQGAIRQVNARHVFVFPNNGNVILAAQQAASLTEDRKVYVVPTKNVAMGIAAAVAFQEDAAPEDNFRRMDEASQHVKTGTVTYAVRDSEYNNIHIKQGDIIGLHNGQIEYSGKDVHDVAMQMMKAVVDEESELITVYYGADTNEADAQALADEIGREFPDCDVECHRGGQPLYYYLISVE